VPFTIRTSASVGTPLPLFDLLAGTTAPNTDATSSAPSFAPSPGNATVPVSVNVGSNTPPGTYDVTLTARVGGVQQRTGTVKLIVVAPEQPAPQQPQQQGDTAPPRHPQEGQEGPRHRDRQRGPDRHRPRDAHAQALSLDPPWR